MKHMITILRKIFRRGPHRNVPSKDGGVDHVITSKYLGCYTARCDSVPEVFGVGQTPDEATIDFFEEYIDRSTELHRQVRKPVPESDLLEGTIAETANRLYNKHWTWTDDDTVFMMLMAIDRLPEGSIHNLKTSIHRSFVQAIVGDGQEHLSWYIDRSVHGLRNRRTGEVIPLELEMVPRTSTA